MSLRQILRESFELLVEEPKYFVPRLISTSISSVWFIVVLDYYLPNFSALSLSTMGMVLYLVSGLLIVLLGVGVSIMLARMVDEGPGLRESFIYTLSRMKTILVVTFGMLVLGMLVSLPLTFGIVVYPLLGTSILIVSVVVSLLLMLTVSFLIYFLPIAIVENSSVLEGVKDSVLASRENYREVTIMLVFSFILLGLAGVAQGLLEFLGYMAFVLSRFTSALITTYLFVVSPKLYLVEN